MENIKDYQQYLKDTTTRVRRPLSSTSMPHGAALVRQWLPCFSVWRKSTKVA